MAFHRRALSVTMPALCAPRHASPRCRTFFAPDVHRTAEPAIFRRPIVRIRDTAADAFEFSRRFEIALYIPCCCRHDVSPHFDGDIIVTPSDDISLSPFPTRHAPLPCPPAQPITLAAVTPCRCLFAFIHAAVITL